MKQTKVAVPYTTVYFAHLMSATNLHDRFIRFHGRPTEDFLEWVEKTRKLIERKYGTTVVVNCSVITI